MCATCGCEEHEEGHGHDHRHGHDHGIGHGHGHGHGHDERGRTLTIEKDLLAKNDAIAASNRRQALRDGVTIFNLIGGPGAGKTTLLEALVTALRPVVPVAVIEGDQATDRDARRIEATGCPVTQINTGAGCHLDAAMIRRGLDRLSPPRGSVVFVENVGNLVCPALFDLGERAKVVVMSATEGDDKPLKYPHVFRAAKLFTLTKTDLLPHVPFDAARCVEHARMVAGPDLGFLPLSALRGEGIDALATWIRAEAAR